MATCYKKVKDLTGGPADIPAFSSPSFPLQHGCQLLVTPGSRRPRRRWVTAPQIQMKSKSNNHWASLLLWMNGSDEHTHTYTHCTFEWFSMLRLPVSHSGWLLAAAGRTRLTVGPPELEWPFGADSITNSLGLIDLFWHGHEPIGLSWKTATLAGHWSAGSWCFIGPSTCLSICPCPCPSSGSPREDSSSETVLKQRRALNCSHRSLSCYYAIFWNTGRWCRWWECVINHSIAQNSNYNPTTEWYIRFSPSVMSP